MDFRWFLVIIAFLVVGKPTNGQGTSPVVPIFVGGGGRRPPPGNDPLVCGWTKTTACESLRASLAMYLHGVLRNKTFPLQAGAFTTEINLMPNSTCYIEAGTAEIIKIPKASNLVIKLADTSRCHKALIRLQAPVVFEYATSITFINLHFSTAHSKELIKNLSGQNVQSKERLESRKYLEFAFSEYVLMRGCEFVIPAIFQAALFNNTYPVFLHRCDFLGMDGQKRVGCLNMLKAAVDVELSETACNLDPGKAMKLLGDHLPEHSFENFPHFLVKDCRFHKLGAPPEMHHSLDANPKLRKAAAFRVAFQRNSRNYTVEITGSNFTQVRSAVSSAVYVMLSQNASHNKIFISDSYFANNEGFFGGALFVRFGNKMVNGNMTDNYVRVQDTKFEKNFARQEGGAVFIRFSGFFDRKVQRRNCMAFRRVQFIENYAGPKGTYPGGALLCKANSRNRKRLTAAQQFKIDGCSGPLALDSCSFEGNRGFGAFFTRYANTRFTGNT